MKNNLEKNYRLALQHFTDYSAKDPTSILAKEHGLIGLARIMTCMETLGFDPEFVDLIALPDFTFTRNKLRWGAGFPYGCIIKFGNELPPLIPLDFRPNCCGIVFAKLGSFDESIGALQQKYYQIVNSYSEIDKNDFNRRNHFMGIYFCAATKQYYFLIHGSFTFVKDALYSERNPELLSASESQNIMGEPFSYLIGRKAQEYYQSYLEHERRTIRYRELIVKELFPHADILFHQTHEGFHDIHTLLLGAYANNAPFTCPIMLAPEMDLPILKIIKPIMGTLYCAPHGGGYALSSISDAQRLTPELSTDYLLTYPNRSKMLTDNVIDMPFFYRTSTGYYWCNEYRMADEVLRVTPIFNLKI